MRECPDAGSDGWKAEKRALIHPAKWQIRQGSQAGRCQDGRLPAFQNCRRDVGRKPGQRKDAADGSLRQPLAGRDLLDRGRPTVEEVVPPAASVGDLSVIGFDNEAVTADMAPPLTSMQLPHADLARHAVKKLVDRITLHPPSARTG